MSLEKQRLIAFGVRSWERTVSATRRQLDRGTDRLPAEQFERLYRSHVVMAAGVAVGAVFALASFVGDRPYAVGAAFSLLSSMVVLREWALREPALRVERAAIGMLVMVFTTLFGLALVAGTFRAPHLYFFALVTMGAAYSLGMRAAILSTAFAMLACVTLAAVGRGFGPPVWIQYGASSLTVNQLVFHLSVLVLVGATCKVASELTRELRELNACLEENVERRTAELKAEIGQRKRVEELSRAVSEELVEASRLAGMAEMATSVLHNVGNVLNSANVATRRLVEMTRTSKIANLEKVTELLRDHEEDLPGYFASDPRAKSVIPYLLALGDNLHSQRQGFEAELRLLGTSLDHIKRVIAAQQASVGRSYGAHEEVEPRALVSDAISLGLSGAPDVEVHINDEPDLPSVLTDAHAMIQILINLLRNARDSARQARGAFPGK